MEGPAAAIISFGLLPNSVCMRSMVFFIIPIAVPRQPLCTAAIMRRALSSSRIVPQSAVRTNRAVFKSRVIIPS